MSRTLSVKDYGKDTGYGRFFVTADSGTADEDIIRIGTNNFKEVQEIINEWHTPGSGSPDNKRATAMACV